METNINYTNLTSVSFCLDCFKAGYPVVSQFSAFLDNRSNIIFRTRIMPEFFKRFRYTPGITPHLFMSKTVDPEKHIVGYLCSCGVCDVKFSDQGELKRVTSVKGEMSIERWLEREREVLRLKQ